MPNPETGTLPPLEWIRSFEAAGRLGNFTAAATELGLTQASVSQHIRFLEDRLGVSLFRRLQRGVELSADGEAYLPHIENALSIIRRGTSDLFGRPSKRLSISAPASPLALWIAPRLKLFNRAFPNIELSLSSIHREVDYDRGETDYQVRYGHGNWQDMAAIQLYQESLAPACSPKLLKGNPDLDWRELPVLSVKGARDGWQEWARNRGTPLPMAPSLRFDSFMTALEAARSGAGILLASLPLIQQDLKSGHMILLEEKPHIMTLGTWLTWKQDRPHNQLHVGLVKSLKKKKVRF